MSGTANQCQPVTFNQNCVEARKRHAEGTGLAVQLRDSQLGDASPVLTVTPRAFRTLLGSIKQA